MKYQLTQPVYANTSGCGGPADCATKDILHSSKVQMKLIVWLEAQKQVLLFQM